MKNKFFPPETEEIIQNALRAFRHLVARRDDRLFTDFLPQGYHYTTLSCVDEMFHEQAIIAKFYLGMLITLMDDFADHPDHVNSDLLHEMYKIPFELSGINKNHLNEKEIAILNLARDIAEKMLENMKHFPGFNPFRSILEFDLLRFYQANHFSGLVTQHPAMVNTDELRELRPFNMGMVIAGMIDIFASPGFQPEEIGTARRIFHLGQRFGSICNNLTTFLRELEEGDITNEIVVTGLERRLISAEDLKYLPNEIIAQKLQPVMIEMEKEQNHLLETILKFHSQIISFRCDQYVIGLKHLKILHESMRGII